MALPSPANCGSFIKMDGDFHPRLWWHPAQLESGPPEQQVHIPVSGPTPSLSGLFIGSDRG